MLKRICAIIFTLFSVLSIGYAYYNIEMKAASSTYLAGGNLTGRVNKAPSNLTGSKNNIGMKKGDRYYLGKNTVGDDEAVGWQLLTDQIVSGTVKEESWFAMTTEAIKKEKAYDSVPTYYMYTSLTTKVPGSTSANLHGWVANYDESNVYAIMNDFNNQFTNLKYLNLIGTYLPDSVNARLNKMTAIFSKTSGRHIYNLLKEYIRTTDFGQTSFLMGWYDIVEDKIAINESDGVVVPTVKLGAADLKFDDIYFLNSMYENLIDNISNSLLAINGPYGYGFYQKNTITLPYAVRPQIFIKKDTVVFAVSPSNIASSNLSLINNPVLSNGYSNITTDAIGETMKIRYYDSSMSVSLDSSLQNSIGNDLLKKNGTFQVAKEETIQIKANGNNVVPNSTVSIIVFNQDGDLVAYSPLGNATGTFADYQVNLSGLNVGSYQIAVVNEEFDSIDYDVARSSLISDVIELEIVETISDLSFTSKPNLEFNQNVNVGDTVGTISSQNGVGTPVYTIIADPAYPNEYTHVSLASDGKTVVVNNAPLHAGTYHFKIQAQDENGDPDPALETNASFIVNKSNLMAAFDEPNQTKKSIAQATTGWSEKASATPSICTKVTYSKSGGSVGIINLDPDTGAITYTGGTAYGKITIKATADDDPGSGYDDYEPSEVTKEIVIYREVDGNVTPDSASSDSSIPTFKTSDANIKPNGIIGTIHGTLGTPDNITSGVTTYKFGLKNVDDHSYFSVDTNTGIIKTTADLSATTGTYQITVTISDKWSTKEIPVTINVGMAPAENLKFYENTTSNTIITTKSAVLTDTGITVYATVKGSSNTNPVAYRIKDGSTNVITVHPSSGAITINGVGSVVIVAEKAGNTGQANAIAELTFIVTAGSQQFIYTDASGNELPKSGNDYDDYSEVYGQGKTFQLYTAGNPPGTNITYALKAGSPTDVLSVDPNGLVSIYNASLNTQIGQVIVEATSHDPSGNYSDKTIELSIVITKANQTISFSGVTSAQNGRGTVTPIITEQDISSNDGGASISDTNYYISVDASASGIAWTNNGVDIDYNYTGNTTIEIPLEVTKAGNRNYNSATATGKMKILSPSESTLSINQPGKIYYGDHFTLRSLQDDSSSNNVQYTFTVDNTIFVSNPTVNGNMADFDALKCSNGTKINITVTRTADSEVTLSKKITIEVLPKDIDVIIDDKMKQKGEPNPPLTFQDFTSQLVSWNGVQDVVDLNDVKLSTTATTNSKSGSYPITGNTKEMNTTYPNYNFIFKEGKLMVDTKIDKDVDGDGKPDFNDPDGDGCPDLNIKWKDDDGNWIVINGDRDYDGIPDLNIDSDGDGTPDLNIDTDKDGKPDINLVILKKSDWKPTKCVVQSATVKEEYCTGTNAKPQINVDTDSDNIPNINIDTDGDMKADFNISKDGKNPNVNIGKIHAWTPDQDYTVNQFTYDTISKENAKPEINIDTDGDGRPDLNLDLDNDGIPDMNIDGDGDGIPDVNIDTTGDGKPNINIDTDDDGKPDENIVEIQEWKPSKDGNKDGFLFDTMEIEQKTELEDNGVKVEKPDGTPFLPNFALKVEDVTDTKQSEITEDAKEFIEETQEVKKVYDVKLFKDDVEVQPDGTLKIKIPYEGIKNPILIRKNANGEYERIEYKTEEGYLVYETDELGIVSIIGDKEFETSVKGTYTPNIGGAITGDETNIYRNLGFMMIGIIMIGYLIKNKQKDTFQ